MEDLLPVLNLIFDFGCLVLIALVQGVIYPSFTFYNKEALFRWHRKYVERVSAVVIPLMGGQLLLSLSIYYFRYQPFYLVKLLLVLLVWLLTFTIFVPLHNRISKENHSEKVSMITEDLVKKNWYRTVLWILIFILQVSLFFFG